MASNKGSSESYCPTEISCSSVTRAKEGSRDKSARRANIGPSSSRRSFLLTASHESVAAQRTMTPTSLECSKYVWLNTTWLILSSRCKQGPLDWAMHSRGDYAGQHSCCIDASQQRTPL
eukprot:scaffold276937_cov17-Tisochrysis_lutea.AAC.1